MTEEKFLEMMSDIDEDLVLLADKPVPFRRKRGFKVMLIAAVLACAMVLTTVAGAFTLAVGSGILLPDEDVQDQTDTDQSSNKPGGLVGGLLDVDWEALKDAFGNDGGVNWQEVLSALQGKDNADQGERLEGNVYKSVKLDDGTVKIVEIAEFEVSSGQTVIEIPETLGGLTVTTIGKYAFANRPDITHVSLPDTVTTIESSAFSGCTDLVTVQLGKNVQVISEYAFSDCTLLTSINLPDTLQWLGEYAFANCTSLTDVKIPDGIKEISDYAFYGTAIKKVYIPASVMRIGDYAFAECHDLESVSFADLSSLASSSMNVMISLAQPYLESIGESAFDGTAISSLYIPSSVTNMHDVDFHECWNLQAVIFDGNAPTVQVAPSHDRSSPAYTVYYKFGAQGFGEGVWYGYTCMQMQYETNKDVKNQLKKARFSEVPFHNVIILTDTVLGGVTEEVTVIESWSKFQSFSAVLNSPRYTREYFSDYAIVIIKVKHTSAEQVMGLAALGAQLYTTGGVYYFDLCPVVMMDSPVGDQPDDVQYTYVIAEVKRANIRKDDVTRVGKVIAYEIETGNGSTYHGSLSEVLGN